MTNFKIKLNLKKDYPNCNTESIINCPITMNGKCIGVITNYYINEDIATGCIYGDITPNFDINMQNIISLEFIDDIKEVTNV